MNLRLAALALCLGATNAGAQTLLWSEDFQNDALEGWTTPTLGLRDVIDQQLVLLRDVGPYQPQKPLSTHLATLREIPGTGPLADQDTVAMRIDWVAPHQDDAWAGIHAVWAVADYQGYALFVDEDEIALIKYWDNVTRLAWFFYEQPELHRERLTLELAFKRVGLDLSITSRVLDPENAHAVLFERTVTDTPESDPVLVDGIFKGSLADPDPVGAPWPITVPSMNVDLNLQWVGDEPATAQVVFDNLEVWRYATPELTVGRAVVLSWPAASEGFALESSRQIEGPWEPLSDPWYRSQADQIQVAVPSTDIRKFYRLRFNP